MNNFDKYSVTVWRGDSNPKMLLGAPVGMTTLELAKHLDESSNDSIFLTYEPVELFSLEGSLEMRTSPEEQWGNGTTWRSMFRPVTTFLDGQIRISGFEETKEGQLVVALWIIE
jgi:hypothetical protein